MYPKVYTVEWQGKNPIANLYDQVILEIFDSKEKAIKYVKDYLTVNKKGLIFDNSDEFPDDEMIECEYIYFHYDSDNQMLYTNERIWIDHHRLK